MEKMVSEDVDEEEDEDVVSITKTMKKFLKTHGSVKGSDSNSNPSHFTCYHFQQKWSFCKKLPQEGWQSVRKGSREGLIQREESHDGRCLE